MRFQLVKKTKRKKPLYFLQAEVKKKLLAKRTKLNKRIRYIKIKSKRKKKLIYKIKALKKLIITAAEKRRQQRKVKREKKKQIRQKKKRARLGVVKAAVKRRRKSLYKRLKIPEKNVAAWEE